MDRPLGYYVHHHGDGHRQRALAIAHAMPDGTTLLGTALAGRTESLPCVDLSDDRIDETFSGIDDAERPTALHYAPLDHEGIRLRTAQVAQWIAEARPRLMVVDVSVEIAMLARLASVRTVYVRLSGKRLDAPHLDAFHGATALLAPFDAALDDPAIPDWIRRKTFYAAGLLRTKPMVVAVEADLVLVVIGKGGTASSGEHWAQAARAAPHYRWRVIGPCTVPADMPSNLEMRGWVDDARTMVASAGIVVGAAGDGLVSAVLAHRRPFICLPEARPFDEQVSKARRLEAIGAAVVVERRPASGHWPTLLTEAMAKATHWPAQLAGPSGPERVAAWLSTLSTNVTSTWSRTA